jgi:hypothetical protein
MTCKCDYSCTCPECQERIEQENQKQYNEEVKDWMIECIKLLGKKFDVEIPEPPERRY